MANISERTVHRVVEYLKENGLIKRIGSDRGGHWEMIDESKE
jgi:predicted HTH transcriptional regulator